MLSNQAHQQPKLGTSGITHLLSTGELSGKTCSPVIDGPTGIALRSDIVVPGLGDEMLTRIGENKPALREQDCPHYDECRANICPLDAEWDKRNHLNDEPVCLYLLESGKR